MSLTFESVHMRTVSVPLRNPIVSKVGQFTHWPLILIDVHTREGITGHSYLEPYVEKAIPAICSMIQVLANLLHVPRVQHGPVLRISHGEISSFFGTLLLPKSGAK